MLIKKHNSFPGHKQAVYALKKSRIFPGFYSAGGDGSLIRWSIEEGIPPLLLAQVPSPVFSMTFDKKENSAFLGLMSGEVFALDLQGHKVRWQTKADGLSVYDLQIDGSSLVLARKEGFITILNISDGRLSEEINISDNNIRRMRRTADKEWILGTSSGKILRVKPSWDNPVTMIPPHEGPVFSLAMDKEGDRLFSGAGDARIKVWNVQENYDLCHVIPAHLATVNDLSVSPDGKFLISAGRDKHIKIWDSRTYELLKVIQKENLEGHLHSVNRICWLDSQSFLSAGDDRVINFWTIESEKT